ncbi:MAG: hypothetical protein U0805_15695 [Pirellulales bacterium]
MRLYKLSWCLWIAGASIIALSWVDIVTHKVGWIGFWIAMTGTGLSFIPHLQTPQPPPPVDEDDDLINDNA